MSGHFGFSYVGAIYLVMLFIPNIVWAKYQPSNYSSADENRVLVFLERVGEVAVSCTVLIFSDFNIRPCGWWMLWLPGSAVAMILYEIYWIRYFRSDKTLADFYSSLLGIPAAGATLPVIGFLLLGIYGKNLWLLLSVVVLGVGHIGIHLEHKRAISFN